MVAYADDLAIIVEEKTTDGLMRKVNKTLRNVAKWMREHSLKLAPAKTEAIAMWDMKRARNIEFKLEGHRITPQKEVKYLGVIIDRGLIFGPHVEYACQKAEKSASALTRLMPNIGGAHMAKRKLLAEGEVDYYMTQALTGHGSFLSYLKKIGKTNDDAYPECREPDTACHTLFECERW
ncbi:hypothetical protein NQ315_015607 [Exocentrus adspersus]|uniref:Reverse transcriptase domain-containing protein n=1 Tax=Exocentrus adspersus TaxID=1586481 RepID=A0AAV8V8D2_9CUCU|nr:hypothetical protein NQ315_015607 [Exocentrus adspersus]